MATEAQLVDALQKADAAGDTQSAQQFAGMIRQMRAQSTGPQPPAPAQQTPEQRADAAGYQAGSESSPVMSGIRSAADTATFGLNNYINAAARYVGQRATGVQNPDTFSSDLAYSRGVNRGSADQNPSASIVGDVAGIPLGGGGLSIAAKGASRLPIVGRAVQASLRALQLQKGQLVGNAARLATAGAAASGVNSVAQGNDLPQTAEQMGVGGVLGVGGGAVAHVVAKAAQPVVTKAISLLAKHIDETPADLAAATANFRAMAGRNPSMQEILGLKSVGGIKDLASDNPTLGADLAEARRMETSTLPQKATGSNSQPTDVNTLVSMRQDKMDQAMDPIRSKPVTLGPTDLPVLEDENLAGALDKNRKMRANVAQAIQDIHTNGNSQSLTLDDIDNIRESLRNKQSVYSNPNSDLHDRVLARDFGRLAGGVTSMGVRNEPAYGQALSEYGADSRFISGFKHGFSGSAEGEATHPELIHALGSQEGQQGFAAGNAEFNAARNRQIISPVAPKPQEGYSPEQAIHAAAALAYHSPQGILYHMARAIPGLKASPEVQKVAARYLADPKMLQQGINLLRKGGATDADIGRLSAAVAASAGANGARATSGGQ